ncbi:MAG: DUF1080 domain-containing protein [Acidobacteria bacterium]|nr:DUF1080 domain-containing protein [Acidobacteriota bacterium]
MTRLILCSLFLLAAWPLPANPKFNGRWDISVAGHPAGRAWWLELAGVGTAAPKGTFISAYAGDLNVIDEINIKGDELVFSFRPRNQGLLVYKARLVGDKLEGTFESGGQTRLRWTGVRAAEIREKDDGSWKRGRPVPLFNGKDLTGWKGLIANRELGWTVKDGALTNTPKANNLVGEQSFWNFELSVDFRLGPRSNSGLGLRGRYEVQILEDYGRPLDKHSNGALYSRIVPGMPASKPAGEWQTYEIRLVGRELSVVLNGKKIIDRGVIDGLTAMAIDANEAEPGPLVLQGDHGAVEFRKIVLTPLTR